MEISFPSFSNEFFPSSVLVCLVAGFLFFFPLSFPLLLDIFFCFAWKENAEISDMGKEKSGYLGKLW